MIFKIAGKELREQFREGRFRVMMLAMCVLLIITVVIGHHYYAWVNQQQTVAQENARQVWVSQDAKNPHAAAHYGTFVFKPKDPLSLMDQGVDRYAGISIYLEGHHRHEAQYMAAQDQTAISRFGNLTPEFILLVLIPLFIIIIGFNAFTSEREKGTLRLLKSQGVSSWALAGGKWLGLFLVILLMILPIWMLATVLLANVPEFGAFNLGALTLLFLFFLMYYAVFINLTLAVSACVKTSHTSLVVLLAVWMVVCLLAPKLANRVATTAYPYPTEKEFMAAIQDEKLHGVDGHDAFSVAAKKLEEETLQQYQVDSVQQLPFNWDGYRMQKGEEYGAEIYFRHYDQLKTITNKQGTVYQATSVVSPYLPVRFLSMALCRTDYAAHWQFNDAAERYRMMLMNRLNTHFANHSRYGDWSYKADKSLWAEIPEFSYQPAGYGQIMQDHVGEAVLLVVWLVISSLLLTLSVKKLSVL